MSTLSAAGGYRRSKLGLKLGPIAGLFALLLLFGLFATGLAAPASATEGPQAERPASIEEVGSGSEIAREFMPPPHEQPTWFLGPLLVLTGGAVLASVYLLIVYLVWQPRFARERAEKSKKKRR